MSVEKSDVGGGSRRMNTGVNASVLNTKDQSKKGSKPTEDTKSESRREQNIVWGGNDLKDDAQEMSNAAGEAALMDKPKRGRWLNKLESAEESTSNIALVKKRQLSHRFPTPYPRPRTNLNESDE